MRWRRRFIRRYIRLFAYLAKAKFTVGAIIVARSGEKVLLVRQRHIEEHWSFPAGFSHSGETLANTASRELAEETGISIQIRPTEMVLTYPQPWARHLDAVFLVDASGEPVVQDNREIAEARWWLVDNMPPLSRESQYALTQVPDLLDRTPSEPRPTVLLRQGSRMELRRFGLAGLALALAAAAGVLVVMRSGEKNPDWTLPLAVFIGGIVLDVIYYAVALRFHTRRHPGRGDHQMAWPIDDIAGTAREDTENISADDALIYYQALVDPEELIARISETAEPAGRSTLISSAYVLHLSSYGQRRSTYLPLELVPKGELQDGLKIYTGSETRISSINHREVVVRSSAVIGKLLRAAFDSEAKFRSFYTEDRQVTIANLLCCDPAEDGSLRVQYTRLEEDLSALANRIREPRKQYVVAVQRLIKVLFKNYPICVDLAPDLPTSATRTLRFRIERRAFARYRHTEDRGLHGLVRRRLDWLRHTFNIRSTVIAFPLRNAERCESYHLQIKGPEGTYLARQRVAIFPSGREVNLSGLSHAFRARMGQQYSHLYVKSGRNLADTYFENNFFEEPPGSVGVATMSAIAATLLIWISALAKMGYGSLGTSDIFAVTLTLPAIATAWAGFDRSVNVGGTLVARLSSIVTIFVSLISALTFALVHTYAPKQTPNSNLISSLTLTERPYFAVWATLISIATINLFVCMGSWQLRSEVQRKFLTRPLKGE